MSRIMTIWLPRWPVQRRLTERPDWRKRPVFVCLGRAAQATAGGDPARHAAG